MGQRSTYCKRPRGLARALCFSIAVGLALPAADGATGAARAAQEIPSREQDDLRQTLLDLKRRVAAVPRDRDAQVRLAEALLALLQGSDAEAALDAALAAGAARQDVLLPLMRAWLQQRRFEHLLATSRPMPFDDPERHAQWVALRGIAELRRGDDAAARVAFQEALALIPKQIDALLGSAELALGHGDTVAAHALLEAATRSHPQSAAAWEQLADLDYRLGDLRAAERSLAMAVISAPNPWIPRLKRALVRMDLGELASASAELERIEAAWPNFPALHLARGILQLAEGELLLGIGSLQEYLKYDPTNRLGLQGLAEAAVELGDPDAAEELLRLDLRERRTEPNSNRRLSELLLLRGDSAAVVRLLLPLAESGHADPALLAFLAQGLALEARGAEALRWLSPAISAVPDSAAYRVQAAELLMQQADAAGALRQIDHALSLAPGSRDARLLRIKLLLVMGEPRAALDAATALSTQLPDDAAVLNALGLAHLRADSAGRAAVAFEQALMADPGLTDAAFNLANLRVRGGEYAAARAVLEPLTLTGHHAVQALRMLARIDATQHGAQIAIERLEPKVEEHPQALELRVALAQLLLDTDQPERARRLLRSAPAELQTTPALQALVAESHRALRQFEPAVVAYRAALEQQPESAGIRYRLAATLADMGRVDAAQDVLLEAARRNPTHRLLTPALRQVRAVLPDGKAALAFMERLLALAPDDPRLREAWADFQVQAGAPDAALAVYEDLRRQDPPNLGILKKCVLLHYRLGEPAEAEALLRHWQTLQPGSTEARLMLAESLQA